MSATEELRRLLDERSVKWDSVRNDGSESNSFTEWQVDDNHGKATATEFAVGIGLSVETHHYQLTPEQAIAATLGPKITGDTSDGYHTFNELYHHRAVLFSVIVRDHQEVAWKSKLHHDGTMYDGMFIVGIDTPNGQATYHYDIDPYWNIFDCRELDRAPEWDGHTPSEAIERIATLGRGTCHDVCQEVKYCFTCSECGHIRRFVPGWSNVTYDSQDEFNYCPNCGRKVIE